MQRQIQEKETRTRTRAGSPDEGAGQRRLDDFGIETSESRILLVMSKSTVMGLEYPERIEQLTCFVFTVATTS